MIIDYVDKSGIMRRVQVPDSGVTDLDEGIPVSLHVDDLYPITSIEYRRELVNQLWDRGLIEPKDFLQSGAVEKIRSVLLSIAKHDALSIQSFAKESI